jgi:SNF2 family DNA or RNA helicase
MATKYKGGDEVQCISDPSLIGTVVQIRELHNDIQYYLVNFGPAGRTVKPEVDLRPFVPDPTPYDNLVRGNIDSYQEFQRLITYQRIIRSQPLDNNIYAFNASRTRFFPYQFKPLLKFLASPRHRLLIADEVGLGKTIEAGLILTELRARRDVQRTLIVCPANLTEKWQIELKRRFGEKFTILNARQFLKFIDDYERRPDEENLNGIISLESIRKQTIFDRLEEVAPSFDFVAIDEAHHMRNLQTKLRKVGVLLSRSSDALLMLTATPVHLGNENLFSLLNILDDDEFPDFLTVENRIRHNEPIVKTQFCLGSIPPNVEEAIRLIESTGQSEWIRTNPLRKEILESLAQLRLALSDKIESRQLVLKMQRDIADLNLIGHIFSRTRKRDVQAHFPLRRAFPIRLKFTELEKQFYDTVTTYVRMHSERNVANPQILRWLLNMPQRRMASSIPAMVEFYRQKFLSVSQDVSEDSPFSEDDLNSQLLPEGGFKDAETTLRLLVQNWPEKGQDTKYEKFIEILRVMKKEEQSLKVMVFAFFKDTLGYLKKRLTVDGFKCVLISGDVPPNERTKLVDTFREKKDLEVLLSSRVGSEGLDFQFCDTLFNYDLPWNPMEVEQRIGRLDRIGQESPTIRIFNFWIEGTIEERILGRLYERINIFEKSIGELELILGKEVSNIEKELLIKKLTAEEEEKIIENKFKVIETRMHQLKTLETEAAQFIGTDQYFDEEVKRIRLHRRYITSEQMYRFILDYLKTNCPRTRLEYDQSSNRGSIFPDNNLQSTLLKYAGASSATRYLSSPHDGVPITFDSQIAFDLPNVDFINVLHPLTQAIVRNYEDAGGLQSNVHHVVLNTDALLKGFYLYFIFKLKVKAARSNNTIEMIILDKDLKVACTDDDAEIILGDMVERGFDAKQSCEVKPESLDQAYKDAKSIFHERVERIRKDAERNNDAFLNLRLESLQSSYGKSIKMRSDLLQQANVKKSQARYIRMLEGTIRRLEAEVEAKKRKLEENRTVGVSYDEIAAGILEVA